MPSLTLEVITQSSWRPPCTLLFEDYTLHVMQPHVSQTGGATRAENNIPVLVCVCAHPTAATNTKRFVEGTVVTADATLRSPVPASTVRHVTSRVIAVPDAWAGPASPSTRFGARAPPLPLSWSQTPCQRQPPTTCSTRLRTSAPGTRTPAPPGTCPVSHKRPPTVPISVARNAANSM